MGKRLTGFDYSRPYFYMVTIKCHAESEPLSEIIAPGRCRMLPLTRALVNCIRNFHLGCQAIEPIECFSIMPDHVHLLIKMRDIGAKPLSILPGGGTTEAFQSGEPSAGKRSTPVILRLETVVSLLMQALEGRYSEVTGRRSEIFDASWHDWIVSREGQLAAFTRYIRENPVRKWMRNSHPEYFRRVGKVAFAGREWLGYGNAALLELPVVEPFQCSRKWVEGGDEWNRAVARAERIGPGGAGIGTFMSPCEKVCGNAIFQAGGGMIVLSPEGFGECWHPGRHHEGLCAEGRMLFLTLWPAMERQPTNAELHQRCHKMGDIAMAALGTGGKNT